MRMERKGKGEEIDARGVANKTSSELDVVVRSVSLRGALITKEKREKEKKS